MNQENCIVMAGFPDHVFEGRSPAQLRQGNWTSDITFLDVLRQSWLRQYADYLGHEAAAAYVEQLLSEGRLYAHYEPLTVHAWVDEKIVGVSALRPLQGIDLITMLEVHPDFHGRGIGSQLTRALCSASDRVMAHVSIHQPRVKVFYERLGFHVLDRTRERHGEHELEFDVVARTTDR